MVFWAHVKVVKT